MVVCPPGFDICPLPAEKLGQQVLRLAPACFGKTAACLPAGWVFTDSRIRRLKVFISLLCGDRLAIQDVNKQGIRKVLPVNPLFGGFSRDGIKTRKHGSCWHGPACEYLTEQGASQQGVFPLCKAA